MAIVQIRVTEKHRALFREDLAEWYASARRDLPWRDTDDPYRIWLSEVMLQQTRVEQVEPYYRRFLERFPSVNDLADASLHDVLLCWEGLGYYSRARNLHRAARTVVDEYAGEVPDTLEEIRSLPGVGPYTAAAVLSIAFERPHAVLDGNVIRVLSRFFAVESDVKKQATRRSLQSAADELVDPDAPGDFNQALMELGARICIPRAPSCSMCPVAPACEARRRGIPDSFPVASSRPPVPHFDVVVALISDASGRILIQQRPEDAMLGGLWEFPGGKCRDDEALEDACVREVKEELGVDVVIEQFYYRLAHAYSHFRITLHAYRCAIVNGQVQSATGEALDWVHVDSLGKYAFPRANRRLIEQIVQERREPRLFDA